MKAKTELVVLALALYAVPMLPVRAQDVLPKPQPPFKGKIGRYYQDSKMDVMKLTKAPEGAPNVLLVLIATAGSANGAHSADRFLPRISTASRKRASATPAFTRLPCVRPHAPRF